MDKKQKSEKKSSTHYKKKVSIKKQPKKLGMSIPHLAKQNKQLSSNGK